MTYPKQLISALAKQINKKLVDYFELEKQKYFKDWNNLNHIIEDTLWNYIKNETEKTELKSIFTTQSKMQYQRKKRWSNTYKTNKEKYPVTSKKHPFYSIYYDFHSRSGHSLHKLYGDSDISTVIDHYKIAINNWMQDENSLLSEYPLIAAKTPHQIVSSFQLDLIVNLLAIIVEFFDGNIKSYFAKKPDILLDKPIFAANKFSIPFKASIDSYVADLISFDKDDMVFQMLVNQSMTKPDDVQKFNVFDQKDNQILLTLINNASLDFYKSKTVSMEIGAIAKTINKRPGKHCYQDIKQRLHNMVRTSFRICKKENPDDPIFSFNFFDNVLTPNVDGKEYAIVTFGNVLYDAVIMQKMTTVTSDNYGSLELKLSKLLYHSLQKERIMLSASSTPDENGCLQQSYDYSFFQRIILFKSKKKANNIQLIINSLDEFVEKGIAISQFEYNKDEGIFHLSYLPVFKDESEDLITNTKSYNGTSVPESI